MRLDTLDILGFKSFAQRTEVAFHPGITAIVGPNGCGKTNITDAIRWVLGEQRPTALRGTSMQEVIFNGTRTRKPIGMAEVTLSFTNALGLIPVEYAEVAVTRRVFRDGESQYLLNRVPCNLKDIRDLFMGTGVGSSAYSLIEQKMVDAILSDQADERRFLFEEAAGVTRYKARRKATLRKLEATETDLRRLEDLLSEVRKTTNSLRRQVGRARRFAALQARELRLAIALASAELAILDVRERELGEGVRRLEAERAAGAQARAEREAELVASERELTALRTAERSVREELEAAAAELQARDRERVLGEESRKHAAAEVERLAREISVHEAQGLAFARGLQELSPALESAESEGTRTAVEAAMRREAVSQQATRFESVRDAAREARAARERLADQRLEVRGDLARSLAECDAAATRRRQIEAALSAARGESAGRGETADTGAPSEVPGLEEERAQHARVDGLRELVSEGDAKVSQLARERQGADAELSAIEAELAELTAHRREVQARLETLEGLGEEFAGFGEGARRALAARDEVAPRLSGPLALDLQVADSRYATAIEAYLDLYLDAVCTPEGTEARAILAFWRERSEAGAVWALGETGASRPPAPSGEAEAKLVCRGTEAASLKGELDRHREALLGRLLLTEDLASAIELRRILDADGSGGWYSVAALTGEVLEPSGMMRLPQRKPDGAGSSRFHKAEGVRADLHALAERIRNGEERAAGARSAAAVALEAELAGRALSAGLLGELSSAERELERLRGARGAASRRAAELTDELHAVEERLAGETERASSAEQLAADLERRLAAAELEQSRREAELESTRVEREEALRALGAADLEAQRTAAALAALQREARYRMQGEEEQRRLALEKEHARQGEIECLARLASDALRHAAAVDESARRVEDLRADHRSREDAIRALDAERVGRDAHARAARAAQEEAAGRLHAVEMELAEVLHRRQSIRTVIETEFGRPLEALVADAEKIPVRLEPSEAEETSGFAPLDEPDVTDIESSREQLRAVREKKTALGPVNLLALEEFGSEKDRLDFLEAQYADLAHARAGLREAIRRINGTARELFKETFTRVSENFRSTFGTLFEGGTAQISLADAADPLECEIEISASPRGKRVQAVNLLSGGERALTALSLLFAIYLVKPSPFCILDEVDAPLDDANIGRFLRMLKSFSDRTQFIVVTHNKRTMEAADYLYGVTMEEPGVSTLVSVDFERRPAADEDDATPFARESALVGD
ncbi:MAG: chromosome segregation protein SMC [Gemmatimonadetes bacterium]|nr:chromosome segregation protein SMC [Gemmatimonadota bacterium]